MRKKKQKAISPNDRALPEQKEVLVPVKLTKAQQRLLEVLRDPKSVMLNDTQLMKLAGISRGTFYSAFKNDDFNKMLEMELQAFRNRHDFTVMHRLVDSIKVSTNPRLFEIFQRLQGRLRDEAAKPAQVVVVIGSDIERPKVKVEQAPIEGQVINDESNDTI